jgi:arylsulfatase A-like enzyme
MKQIHKFSHRISFCTHLLGLVLLAMACTRQDAPAPPNLLFVFSDQHTFDMLGCYGNRQVISPNIDQLAREGLRFQHCISNSPTCTPYRSMLMSGRHTLYNGGFVNDQPLIPGHGKKFAEVLRDAGYNTAYVGKWHLYGGDRDRPIPPGEMRYGFDGLFYTNNCHVDFRPGKCFYWNEEGEKVYFDEWEVYGQTRQALAYLDGQRDADRPFALFVSWHPPHDWGKFEGEDGRRHYRYGTLDELMQYYVRDSIRVRPGMESTPDLRRMYHGQMAMVTGVDIAFGWLMDKLEEIGARNNTLVVFTSDHGDMLEFAGAPYPKQYPHDYSLRVPFIMRWPGKLPAGQTTALLFSAMDIMPTVLGLMDLEVPEACQGKNLAGSILAGDEESVGYVPIWSFYHNSFKGVITKDWTYSTLEDATEASLHSVLFDRKHDPYQLNNLFASPAHQAVRDSLWQLTSEWMERFEDPFYTDEDFKRALPLEEWNSNRTRLPIEILQTSINKE